MADLHPEARKLIESGRLAHMVTLNPDGGPQVSCVWVGLDGDDIVSGHLPRNQKVKNVERDGRVAISIETDTVSEMGLIEYLVVRGTARVEEGGAAELLQRLAHTYLGPDVKFPPMDDPPAGYVIRTTPEKVGGVGPWTGKSV
ncbi:MAG TPA: PPOX class F420-dependent oxidoreductase [Solirubrobacterales bacterium]|jgi:PPOX class probable F420-dependent enzyme|nr:PPOX class F420-dependent oxidoreductase [Solirubrobacterales bacterium]